MSAPAARPTPKALVLVVHPNGHVERITTRKELDWARAEGLKPFALTQAAPQGVQS